MAEGLFVSPLIAATKLEWILDRVDPERDGGRAPDGSAAARSTPGSRGGSRAGAVFATDASNASCSGLYDLLGARLERRRSSRRSASPRARCPRSSTRARVLGLASTRPGCRRSRSRRSSATSRRR